MKRHKITLAILVCAAMASGTVLAVPSAAEAAPAQELNTLYWQGHQALGEGNWSLAQQRFAELEKRLRQSEPDAVDAAIYWRAYAFARAGRSDEARMTVERLLQEYPKSRWNQDARELLLRSAHPGPVPKGSGPEAELESLLAQPPAQAIPRLITLMEQADSPRLKKRALFVLSQMDDPGALIQMTAIARGRDPILREEAVRLLAIAGLDENAAPGPNTSPSVSRKREIVDAMHVSGADESLIDTARNSPSASARRNAVQALGRAKSFAALTDLAVRHTDLATRRDAVKALGEAGGRARLVALYPKLVNIPALRDEVLRGLVAAGDTQALRDIESKARSNEEREAVRRALLQSYGNGTN